MALQAYKKEPQIHYVNPRFFFIGYVFTHPFIMFPEDYTPIFFKVSSTNFFALGISLSSICSMMIGIFG